MTHGTEKEEIKEGVSLAKKKGRGGDTTLGHLSVGDLVIPRGQVTPKMRAFMNEFFDVDRYTVGHEANSKNPNTGLPEFYDSGGMGGGYADGGWGTEGGWGGDGGGWGNGFDQDTGFNAGFAPGTEGDGAFGTGSDGGVSANLGADGGYGNFGDGSSPAPLEWGSVQPSGWSLGSFFDELSKALTPTGPPMGGSAADGSQTGQGGLIDSNPPPAGQISAPSVPMANPIASPVVPTLPAPIAPNVPDSLPDIGKYYGNQQLGNLDYARNLLAPYLQGDKNVYGR